MHWGCRQTQDTIRENEAQYYFTAWIEMTMDDLMKAWRWKPIPGCPGRYVLRDVSPYLSLEALLGSKARAMEFQAESAKDTVLVIRFDHGGIISYKRMDGSFLHTLNTEEGFERKLRQLGIDAGGKESEK